MFIAFVIPLYDKEAQSKLKVKLKKLLHALE